MCHAISKAKQSIQNTAQHLTRLEGNPICRPEKALQNMKRNLRKSKKYCQDRSRIKIQTLLAQGFNSWLMVPITISSPFPHRHRHTHGKYQTLPVQVQHYCIKYIYLLSWTYTISDNLWLLQKGLPPFKFMFVQCEGCTVYYTVYSAPVAEILA